MHVFVQCKMPLEFVLMIFNKGAYLTFTSIFHKAFNLFDCEITFESVPVTNQY